MPDAQPTLNQIRQIMMGTADAVPLRGRSVVRAEPRPVAVFPGAFNPLHDGHREMIQLATDALQQEIAVELSVTNVDKAELQIEQILDRIDQFGLGHTVWLTRAATFTKKARVFPGIDPRVVMAQGNCFYPEEPGPFHGLFISNPNVLTDNNYCDEAYGSPDLTALLVKVYKVEGKDLKEIKENLYTGIKSVGGWD